MGEEVALEKGITNISEDPPSDLVNTFHHAIWPFLLIAQFMGVLPVSGIREKKATRVQFKWIYAAVPVALALIGFGTIDLFLSLKIVTERGLKMYTAGPVTFNLTCLLGLITFFGLARHWPDLMKHLSDTERVFLQKAYETKESKRFCFRLRMYGVILLVGAFLEYILSMSNAIYNNYNFISNCNLTVNFWENFFHLERLQLVNVMDFHMWMIPLTEWLAISMKFTWNFIDIFLLLVTTAVASRFEQVHQRIRQLTAKPMSDEFWLRTRIDFMSLVDLLQAFDNRLSGLILLSCVHNLYFICFHVFQSFQQRANILDAIYFWYSLIYVLTRILTSMLSAASIADTTNDVLTAFYEIPLDFWGAELNRFYEIVASDLISITGKGFYFITRRLIFAMGGTVLTYELVLFDQVKDVVDRTDFCTLRKV